MSAVFELLSGLRNRGVHIWAEGDKLRYRTTVGLLSAQDADQIQIHKKAILALLAKIASENSAVLPPIVAADRTLPLVLSFAQQRLWFLSQMQGTRDPYHVPLGLRLKGKLDGEALRWALNKLVARHEPLRTCFETIEGEGFQRIDSGEMSFDLRRYDLEGQPNAEEQLSELMIEEAYAPFDLQRGPVVRGRLIRMARDDHALLITMHHINSDGWSMGILARELRVLYGTFIRRAADPLKPLSIQYVDYAVWQRRCLSGEILAEQSTYWRETLAGASTLLVLPTDRERPGKQDFRGGFVALEIDRPLTGKLKALSRKYGMTLYMTVLAGFAVVLSRLSAQDDLLIGTPTANRNRTELEGLIGFFVNTLVLRINLSGEPTVEEALLRTRAAALGAQEHQDLPFEQVVELAKPTRSLAHTPLFQVMFDWQNNAKEAFDLPGLEVLEIQVPMWTAKFDMTLSFAVSEGRIVGGLNYASALFDVASIRRYAHYLNHALVNMVSDTTQSITAMDLLSGSERHQLLVEWNRTEAEYPKERCIHELFEAQVERAPEATAVVYEEQSLSYGELNGCANQLAHYLRSLGVGPDVLVAICVERSLQMVVGLLAILKAGGAYVPLDPTYPTDRLAYMLEDSAPAVVLSYGSAHQVLDDAVAGLVAKPLVLDLERGVPLWAGLPIVNLDRAEIGLTRSHLAYVIYTSGSTGMPKGVMVEHRGLANLISWHCATFGLDEHDISSSLAGLGFDAAAWELWPPLSVGGRLLLAPSVVNGNPRGLLYWWRCQNLTVSFLPTPLAELGFREGIENHHLRTLLLGGDRALPLPTGLKYSQIVNNYGPTEASVVATSGAIRLSNRAPPIGRPISNTRIYIVDRWCRPVPIGVTGEIYIGGVGVARGYLNRPELTAERFIASPFVSGDRLYKTGDLGRYLPDGNIEFLGRNDFQVKIRGFRIELGEIEARLLRHASVREAIVLAREGQAGEKRLVAYYTGDETDAAELRAHLSSALPDYMVPAAYVRLEMLPLTPNGKLDRKALPDPDEEAYARRAYEAPQGLVETTLAKIWAEVLGIEHIGRHDNFFELGGHSLLATRVVFELNQKHQLRLSLIDFLGNPTISEISRASRPHLGLSNAQAGAPQFVLLRSGSGSAIVTVYFVHPIAGGAASYIELCNHLHDSTVVGLEPPSDLSKFGELNLIKDLSVGYSEAIQSQSPGQRVVLCGWSLGANIAFGIADELQKAGYPPYALALIGPSQVNALSDCHYSDVEPESEAEIWREYERTVIGAKVASRLHSDPRYDLAGSSLKLEMLRALHKEYLPGLSIRFDDARNDFKFFRLIHRSRVFNSESQYRGHVSLILSSKDANNPANDVMDAINKWQQLSSSPISVHHINASHIKLVLHPTYAEEVAAKINFYIDALPNECACL